VPSAHRSRTDKPAIPRLRVALLLGTEHFEGFYGGQLGLTPEAYVEGYRNDWSWDYAKMLRDHGVDPAIYVVSSANGGRRETPDGFAVRFLTLSLLYRPYLRLPVLRRSPPARYLSQVVNAHAFLPGLQRALVADRVQVLLVQEYWTGRFDVLMRRIAIPKLAIDQGLPDRREIKVFKRRTLKRAFRVITQTSVERDKVSRYGGHGERIPNAVDAGTFVPPPAGARRDDHVVLTVARLLDVQKRISDLIRALAILPPPWRLRLLGNGPDEAMLRRLADEEGVADRVEFLGFARDKSVVREHLSRCTVFALPSAYEGLPMALLEAMCCGAAVVASNIPACAEVVTDGEDGLLVGVGEPRRLAEKITQCAARADELGSGARRTIEQRYAQTVVGERVATLVREAAAAG
jgi:glycosyltransferase involved in cell wall biosynthesis